MGHCFSDAWVAVNLGLIVLKRPRANMRISTIEPIVELKQASKRFNTGTTALAEISLSLGPGELITLLGPSGCGKSTVLRLIAGLDNLTSGTIRAPALSSTQHSTAFVFQEPTLMPWATVFDNVWLPLRLQGHSKQTAQSRVQTALTNVGLKDFAHAYPAQLSGGMRMRASIARALITEPQVLLMDEPFGALDDLTRQKLNDDLLRWQQERAVATLFVTHNLAEAVFLSRRVLVMEARPGRIIHEMLIDQPYPRTSEFRSSMKFLEHCRELSDALERGMVAGVTAS